MFAIAYRILPVSWKFVSFRSTEEFLVENGVLVKGFGLIVTDQNFGEGLRCGTELVPILRNLYSYRGLVIGCSGDDLSADFVLAGANLFWSKPPPQNPTILQQLVDCRDLLVIHK
jgi:hypothetical protein